MKNEIVESIVTGLIGLGFFAFLIAATFINSNHEIEMARIECEQSNEQ